MNILGRLKKAKQFLLFIQSQSILKPLIAHTTLPLKQTSLHFQKTSDEDAYISITPPIDIDQSKHWEENCNVRF